MGGCSAPVGATASKVATNRCLRDTWDQPEPSPVPEPLPGRIELLRHPTGVVAVFGVDQIPTRTEDQILLLLDEPQLVTPEVRAHPADARLGGPDQPARRGDGEQPRDCADQ